MSSSELSKGFLNLVTFVTEASSDSLPTHAKLQKFTFKNPSERITQIIE